MWELGMDRKKGGGREGKGWGLELMQELGKFRRKMEAKTNGGRGREKGLGFCLTDKARGVTGVPADLARNQIA